MAEMDAQKRVHDQEVETMSCGHRLEMENAKERQREELESLQREWETERTATRRRYEDELSQLQQKFRVEETRWMEVVNADKAKFLSQVKKRCWQGFGFERLTDDLHVTCGWAGAVMKR